MVAAVKNNDEEMLTLAVVIASIGAVIGLGKLLQSGESLTLRLAVGRAITTAALGIMAFVGLALIPELPPLALVGIAAFLASIGESGIERLLQRYTRDGDP